MKYINLNDFRGRLSKIFAIRRTTNLYLAIISISEVDADFEFHANCLYMPYAYGGPLQFIHSVYWFGFGQPVSQVRLTGT